MDKGENKEKVVCEMSEKTVKKLDEKESFKQIMNYDSAISETGNILQKNVSKNILIMRCNLIIRMIC